jgi:hypothetical protein
MSELSSLHVSAAELVSEMKKTVSTISKLWGKISGQCAFRLSGPFAMVLPFSARHFKSCRFSYGFAFFRLPFFPIAVSSACLFSVALFTADPTVYVYVCLYTGRSSRATSGQKPLAARLEIPRIAGATGSVVQLWNRQSVHKLFQRKHRRHTHIF